MPPVKRWFPLSHDINRDPEIWELTDKYGVSGIRVWLEMLSIADRNDGVIATDESIIRSLSIASNSIQRQVKSILEFTQSKLWVSSEYPLRVVKYKKYHRTRGTNEALSEPSEPNLTKPIPPKSPKGGLAVDINFEKFWTAYPRKVAKAAALKAWKKEAGYLTDVQDRIFAALEWQKKQPQWIKDDGQFIPHAATWLNQRRWEDISKVFPTAKPTLVPPILREARPSEDEIRKGRDFLNQTLSKLAGKMGG